MKGYCWRAPAQGWGRSKRGDLLDMSPWMLVNGEWNFMEEGHQRKVEFCFPHGITTELCGTLYN